jgi:hypothetical protein
MKNKLRFLAVALIAGGTMFAQTRVSIGIGIGGYGPGSYAPPAYTQYQPPCPGPDYTWVDGYWSPQGSGRAWTAGFWRAPVAPRYVAPRYSNDYRGNDRDRGNARYRADDRNRGGDRHDDRGRGNGYSNGFRR